MKLNQKLISAYMKEKYYNIEHPENQMIRVGKNHDSIELFIGGKWRDYENAKGAGMILTNIGNDFGLFLEILKENPERLAQILNYDVRKGRFGKYFK